MRFTFAALLCVVFATAAPAADKTLRMFVAYCPNDFTGAGHIVDVDPRSGTFTVGAHVTFPSEVFGCVAYYSPSFAFDPQDSNTLWFDFTSDTGFFLAVDTRHGNTTHFSSASLFFSGFIDFKVFGGKNLRGITGTVTQDGYCSDACLGYGVQDIARHDYHRLSVLPFKEGADDTSFEDETTGTFYFQGSYDLRAQTCGPASSSQCLIAINSTTGALLNAVYTPNWQAFKFAGKANADGEVLAFMSAFPPLSQACGASSGNHSQYAFGMVNLQSAVATQLTCLNASVVIDTDEWISAFSPDYSLFATASGNSEGDPAQLLVVDVPTGRTVLNSQLQGLPQAMKADMGLIFIWAVEFVGGAAPAAVPHNAS